MTNGATSVNGEPSNAPLAEHVVARLRPHARVLFWPTLLLFAVCGATGYFYTNLPEQWQNIALAAGAGAVILFLWLLPFASWLNRRYTITTRRIIFRHGFFVRTRQELLHSRGYDVTVRQTWLQSAFGSGDVRINSGLEHPLVLKDVPNANLVQQVLHDLIEETQIVRGFRPASTGSTNAQSALANQTVPWSHR